MSKISLKPNDSGTGAFTLESPNSNTNRTLTLPDSSGTVATEENLPAGYTDSDALSLFNATGSAPVYACRAWVNFDGTGTVSIRESGNVSSITDNGTGDYTVNFSNAMPDTNYTPVSGALGDTFYGTILILGESGSTGALKGKFVGSLRFVTTESNGSTTPSKSDTNEINLAIFR